MSRVGGGLYCKREKYNKIVFNFVKLNFLLWQVLLITKIW